MRKSLLVLAALCSLAATISVPAANAQRGMLVGIQDDAMTVTGNPATTFATLRTLRTQIVRINLQWGGKFGVASDRRPAHPQDPADPAYDWTLYDRAVRYAAANRIQVLFTILWTPKWANGGRAQNVPPTNSRDLRNFAYAAAERYSGKYIVTDDNGDGQTYMPAVKKWLAWNEPNNPVWLKQASGGRFTSPRAYALICNAVYQGVHATNFAGEMVGCGATGPRGNNQARSSRPSMSPLAFMRAARKAGMRTMDAYAHHPYYGNRTDTPATPGRGGAVQLGNIRVLIAQANKLFGRKPIWITEYAFQTPPDRLFGVSYAKQARYLSQAFAIARRTPQVTLMIWFMLRDDTNLNIGWQSGLLTAKGKRKPSFNAFRRLPH